MKTAKAKNIAEIMEKSWVLDKQQYDADPGPLLTLISFFFKVNLFPRLVPIRGGGHFSGLIP